MSTQTKQCDACKASVTFTGHRGFGPAHTACPMKGQSAVSPDHKPCPVHGVLVWAVGPYSTFRTCHSHCGAGKRGKPWRYCAPRGEHAGQEHEEHEITAPTAPTATPAPKSVEIQMESKEEPEVTTTTTISTPTTINLKALGTLGDAIQVYVDQRATQLASEMITEALKDAKVGGPARVDWTVNGVQFASVEGTHHKALPRMLKLYAAGVRNFLIVGPAGSGKTTLVHDFATALGKQWAGVSCSSGLSESKLIGKGIPDLTTGKSLYQTTEFVDSYEGTGRFVGGGVFAFDEFDAADANVLIVTNSALANGHMSLVDRVECPTATRHADSVIIAAANTYGNGADRMYAGRNQLDAATLDRFVGATIEVDYDRELESALVGDAHICARVWQVRDKVTNARMRRIVGTRFLLAVTRLVKGAGDTLDEALRACTVGWTDDERSRAGVA